MNDPPPAPVPPALSLARVDSLDLLRGVAILGIFLMNTWTMGMPQDAYTNPNAYTLDWVPGAGFPADSEMIQCVEFWVYAVIHLLADMKFITMFSILFGAGVILQAERLAARGLTPWRIHYGRMAVLLLFGLIHGIAIWYGDILVTYALCGMLLFPLRKCSPGFLLFLGLLMIGVPTLINFATLSGSPIAPLKVLQSWEGQTYLGGNDLELALYRGGWAGQVSHRFNITWRGDTIEFLLWGFWRCGGAMLVGMALLKQKFFHGGWSAPAYATLAILAAPLGWMVTWLGVVFNESIGWNDAWGEVFSIWGLGQEFNYWGSLITEIGYLSLGVLVALRAADPARTILRKCLVPIRSIGRMALSCYILESLIGTWFFYGQGLGMFGYLTRLQMVGVVFVVWTLLLVISPIWLSAFRQGPLEWFWHRLVYWRGEPPPLGEPASAD